MIYSDLHKLPPCEKVQILFADVSGGLLPEPRFVFVIKTCSMLVQSCRGTFQTLDNIKIQAYSRLNLDLCINVNTLVNTNDSSVNVFLTFSFLSRLSFLPLPMTKPHLSAGMVYVTSCRGPGEPIVQSPRPLTRPPRNAEPKPSRSCENSNM